VLLALTLGGGWLWVRADRDVRIARVTRDVNEALNNVTALRERAKGATTGGAALFAQAREQAQRALALVDNGPADVALKDQVHHLKTELDEEDKDRVLVAALDEARLAQAETLSQSRFAPERAVPKFREVFAAELKPDYAEAHCNLGSALKEQGRRRRQQLLAQPHGTLWWLFRRQPDRNAPSILSGC
jgi:hypothetical protein